MYNAPIYGISIQYSNPEDSSDMLPPIDCNLIQKIVGTYLYYGIALDNTPMVALNYISLEQSKATDNTSKKITKLLNYLATNQRWSSNITPVECNFTSTVMPPTSPLEKPESGQEEFTTSVTRLQTHKI